MRSRPAQRGISLISVLVSAALIGILVMVVTRHTRQSFQTMNTIDARANVEELRRYVRLGLDCKNTVAALPAPCNAGTFFAIQRGNATTLVQVPVGATYTMLGSSSLRASCTSTAKQWLVQYSTDKVTWLPLFEVPLICP